jgi:GNAT superfamily N-acetyltransferase
MQIGKFKLDYYKDKNVGDCFILKDESIQIATAIFKKSDSQKVYDNFGIRYVKNINNIDNDLMCIELLKVIPTHQLKGIGTKLVNAITEKAKESKCNGVFVRAQPSEDSSLNFEELVKFYNKFGFVEIKRISKSECLMLLLLK